MFPSGVIVSIQPHPQSALSNPASIIAIARECTTWASALRIEGNNVSIVADSVKIPIIGLRKTKINALNTLITARIEEAKTIAEFGAHYVAMECTDRCDPERIGWSVSFGIKVIADVADVEHAIMAEEMGCVAVTTALSGYINKVTHSFVGPDIALVEACVKKVKIPVIAEGRYWTPKQLGEARDAGAYAVCVGAAITDPKVLTLHNKICFDGSWKDLAKNEYRDLEYTR
jgi:N-acylglucosamine-6-phosphate 2-epimerase